MIRLAQSPDALPVTALVRAAYESYVPLLGRNPQPMDDNHAALIAAGEVFLLEQGGELAGVLVIQQQDRHELLIRTIAIAPTSQRRGLGTRLIDYAERVADDRGISRVRLYTNEVMDGTERLYRRLGFDETGREGLAGRRVIYMTKEVLHSRTSWYDVIVTDPTICFGKVRIAGTRHYIDHLLGMIQEGASLTDIPVEYPDLTGEQLKSMMGFVRDLVASRRNALKGEQKNV